MMRNSEDLRFGVGGRAALSADVLAASAPSAPRRLPSAQTSRPPSDPQAATAPHPIHVQPLCAALSTARAQIPLVLLNGAQQIRDD